MKLKPLLAGMGILLLAGCAGMKPAAKLSPGETAAHYDSHGVSLAYLVYVPQAAVSAPGRKWPAILFLHGSGERGTNVWAVTKHGPPKIVRDKKDFPFIVFSPQCPPDQHWDAEALARMVRDLELEYPIDPDRMCLTGLSMGGSGTWNLILSHPKLFAAAVPICGRTDTNQLTSLPDDKLAAVKRLPIEVFHGAKDPTVPVHFSEDMTRALKDLGANVRLTIYPEAVHDSWTQTYANPELFEWLLAQNRKNNREK